MSAFDQYADTPNQIKFEGQEVSLTFDRISASTAKVSWNIPRKSSGCASDNQPAYDGIILTLDTTHTANQKLPTNGQVYVGDPTADDNLHAGDKIGSAMVIGSFYGDRDTTHLDITGLAGNTPYYITAHAVDRQLRYHTTGVHAYSQDYGNEKVLGKPAKQNIKVGAPDIGVLPSDPTGLLSGVSYSINAVLDNGRKHTFNFDGDDALTYEDLIDSWNRQVLLIDNPQMSPTHPNAGWYYFDNKTQTLYQWDGITNTPVPVVVNDFEPTVPSIGALWWNGTSVRKWNGTSWLLEYVFNTSFNPILESCDQYWSDGVSLYDWTGTVWHENELLLGADPSAAPTLPKSAHWYNENDYTLYKLTSSCSKWTQTIAQLWSTDPTLPSVNQYWFDETARKVKQFDGSSWIEQPAILADELPSVIPTGSMYYIENDMELYIESGGVFNLTPVFVWDKDPTLPVSGDLWWNENTNELNQWSVTTSAWVQIAPFFIQSIDPRLAADLEPGTFWLNGSSYQKWDGSEWSEIMVTEYPSDPRLLTDGVYWNDGTDIRELVAGDWVSVDVIGNSTDPQTPTSGDFWYDTTTSSLSQYNGIAYSPVAFTTTSLVPQLNTTYFNTTESALKKWNGYGWVDVDPMFTVRLDGTVIRLETLLTGSSAQIEVDPTSSLFLNTTPDMVPLNPIIGSDGLESTPSYAQQGVGTDGSSDERRELIDSIRHQLGYPSVDVELTKQQFDYAIDGAIESLRKRSGMAYKRGFYFMDLQPNQQIYQLTDKKRGFNKIVSVLKMHRIRSSFLSNAEGNGLYGQIALQQMYQMGSFDLISYHMVSQYIETMNQMFAGEIMFNWNEDTRNLLLYKQFHKQERVLVEVVVERTEQNMLKDRFLKGWIEKYAMSQCRLTLSEIRGKFAALPGAGGGISLNAQELAGRADQDLMDLYQQLDDYIVDNPEEYGGQFILG